MDEPLPGHGSATEHTKVIATPFQGDFISQCRDKEKETEKVEKKNVLKKVLFKIPP